MADKKFLDPELAHQEKNALEPNPISSKRGTQGKKDTVTSPSINSLLLARKVLYEHIKAIPIDGANFFMQQEKTYKRELVDIMRRIDQHKITSDITLIELMAQMANHHQSESFNTLVQTIKETLHSTSSIEKDNSVSPPSFP